ncbi:MAG: glycosyltransferase family 2 protein [Roseburia sp.]
MEKLVIIVPCYNEEKMLPIFYQEVEAVMAQIKDIAWEYLLVDDGSADGTLEVMKSLRARDDRVKYISFSRNFGKEAAIYAGLSRMEGDYGVLMDADLQDPPSLLPEMLRLIREEGLDSVGTRRVDRKGEPPIRSFFARCFYRIMNRISDVELVDGARDYRMMTRQVIQALVQMKEYNRFSKGMFSWVGFRTSWLEFENVERAEGESKWSFWKLFAYALEGFIGFSEKPLYLSSVLGTVMCVVSFLAIIFVIVRQLLFGGSAFGWPSLVCIITFIGGIQLLCAGISGLYLSKVYLEVKNRPLYISREEEL